MNATRRKQLAAAYKKLETLQQTAGELQDELESIRDDEQEYFDNMPEGLQGGEKGEAAELVVTNLDELIDTLENVVNAEAGWMVDI